MNYLGLLGLPALYLIAWAMSFNRSKVKLFPILWGLGMQLVFALIIFKQNELSFIGMGILVLLVVNYLFHNADLPVKTIPAKPALISLCAAAVCTLFYFAVCIPLGDRTTQLLGVLTFAITVNAIWLRRPNWSNRLFAVLLTLGFAHCLNQQIYGQTMFKVVTEAMTQFLGLADYGAKFIFGNLADPAYFFPGDRYPGFPGFGFLFAFKVLPTIIFFGGFMGVLYYFGLMQIVIDALSKFMRWTLGTSGAETLSCTANIFVGQTEAPLLVKPFLDKMTVSEMLTVMVGGFATIAGGVLAGYVAMGINAGHLLAASVMAAPGSLVIGKILCPETEHSETAGDVPLPRIDVGENALEATTNGISDGLKLALNVGAMLIGFIALVAVLDTLLHLMDGLIDGQMLGGAFYQYQASSSSSPVTGEFAGIFPGSLQTLFGNLLKPLALLMGVPAQDSATVANLIGVKLSLNEFVAYGSLSSYVENHSITERASVIATYALCGFANFSSIGIQIGGLSALAPNRKADLARVGIRAMFGGAIVSCSTATIAGLLM